MHQEMPKGWTLWTKQIHNSKKNQKKGSNKYNKSTPSPPFSQGLPQWKKTKIWKQNSSASAQKPFPPSNSYHSAPSTNTILCINGVSCTSSSSYLPNLPYQQIKIFFNLDTPKKQNAKAHKSWATIHWFLWLRTENWNIFVHFLNQTQNNKSIMPQEI